MSARPVLTAEDIRKARRTGQTRVVIPAGAIVTQQAREDALQQGISLVAADQESSAPCVAVAAPQSAPVAAPIVTTVPSPAVPPVSGCSKSCGAGPAESQADALFAEVRRQTLAALPANIDPALVDESIRKTLAALKGDGGGCVHCPRREIQSAACSAGAPAWLLEGGGVRLVDSKALNMGSGSAGRSGRVGIMQVLGGENSAQVGYLHCDSGSFSWTFEQAETLVVLEGRLSFTANGASFNAGAGDVCAFPAGSMVTFEAQGPVRCATVGK